VRQTFTLLFLALTWTATANAQSQTDLQGDAPPGGGMWIDSLDLSKIQQDWGSPHAGKSVDNRPIRLDRSHARRDPRENRQAALRR
jgi:hypothetical protein